jgi:hypothetical protein
MELFFVFYNRIKLIAKFAWKNEILKSKITVVGPAAGQHRAAQNLHSFIDLQCWRKFEAYFSPTNTNF